MRERKIRQSRIKRKQEVKRQIVFLVLTTAIVLVLAISSGSFLSKANNSKLDTPSYKYFTSIQITPASSLYAIAEEHMSEHYASADDYVAEVMKINALEEETIYAGQYLIIPYYSEEFR